MARIVHIARAYPPYVAGVERVVEFLAESASEAGHDVTVLCSAMNEPVGTTVTERGVRVERLPTLFTVGVMPVSLRLPQAIRQKIAAADIVHFHEPYPLATLWLLLAPRPRTLLVTWHADIYRQKLLKPYAEWLQHKLADRTDAIFTTTKRMADNSRFLSSHMDRVRLMPFMVDLRPFDKLRDDHDRIAATRRRWGGRYALAFGRLVEYKGFDVLIDALAGTDIRVVLVGKGRLRDSLAAHAQAKGVAGQIVFAGGVDDETARDLYCAAEFFTFPSIHNEGFGLVQLEAMAAGRPVINTNLPTAVPEVSLDGISGITVEPHDAEGLRTAMVKLWTDEQLRNKLAAGALARVRQEFARERVAQRINQVYDEFLSRSR